MLGIINGTIGSKDLVLGKRIFWLLLAIELFYGYQYSRATNRKCRRQDGVESRLLDAGDANAEWRAAGKVEKKKSRSLACFLENEEAWQNGDS